MNKLRRWLIEKLGGEITKSHYPLEPIKVRVSDQPIGVVGYGGTITNPEGLMTDEKEEIARSLGESLLEFGYISFRVEDDYTYDSPLDMVGHKAKRVYAEVRAVKIERDESQ